MNLSSTWTFWDWTVLFLALLSLLAAIILSIYRKKKPSIEEFLLMGRQLGLPLFTISLVASGFGGVTSSVNGFGQMDPPHFWIRSLAFISVFLVYIFVVVPRLRKFSALSIPDLIRGLYGKRSAKMAALFNLFSMLPILYAVLLGGILQSLFGGEYYENLLAGLLAGGVYSAIGGLRSDVYADAVKFFWMALSFGVIFYFSRQNNTLTEVASTNWEALSSLKAGDIFSTFIFSALLGIILIFVDPIIFQRVMSAKSDQVLRWGLLFAAIFWIGFDYFLFNALQAARESFPDLQNFAALSAWAAKTLPPGTQALFWVGVIASLLAMMDSYLLIAGTSLTFDIGNRRHGKVSTHRAGILGVGLGSFLFALVYRPSMESFWKSVGIFWSGALLLPILLPLFMKRRFPGYSFVVSVCVSFFLMLLAYGLRAGSILVFLCGISGGAITFLGFWIFEALRRARLRKVD